jgi:hypothetical protein
MRTILLGAALCALAGSALAGIPNDGLKAQDIADWLKHQHLDAQIDVSKSGATATVIRTSSGDAPFAIYLYGCKKDRCASMQYAVSVTGAQGMTVARVNAWNRQSRYIRAYLDSSGRLYGEYDLDIAPGFSQPALDHSLKRWLSALQRFRLFASLP